jgi:hypothetical protein
MLNDDEEIDVAGRLALPLVGDLSACNVDWWIDADDGGILLYGSCAQVCVRLSVVSKASFMSE